MGSVRVQTLVSGFVLTLIVRLLSITILSVLPIFMRDALHVSDLHLGVYIILVWVGNTGGTGLAVLVVKRPTLASLLGLALILISMIGIPIAGVGSDPLLLGAFTILSGVGMGLPQPFLAPLMYLSSGANQPFSGLGLYSVALAIGLIVGPFLSSVSLSAGGFPLMFGVLATVAAVGVVQVLLRNFLLRGKQFRVNPSEHRSYNFSMRQWLHTLGSMKFREHVRAQLSLFDAVPHLRLIRGRVQRGALRSHSVLRPARLHRLLCGLHGDQTLRHEVDPAGSRYCSCRPSSL